MTLWDDAADAPRKPPSLWPADREPRPVGGPELQYLLFRSYFPHTPTALCIRECIRLAKLAGYPCKAPVLDVGCGDGLFARLAFKTDDVWGIDIDAKEGRWAQASHAYSQIIIGDIVKAVLPRGFFHTCVANCSLEHVPDLPRALEVIYESMAPGGVVYLFVPTADWAEAMRSVRVARRLGASWLGDAIRNGIDGVFRHHHLHDCRGWEDVARAAGFEVLETEPVGSVAMTQAFELFLAPSILGLVTKGITGRWTLSPALRGLFSLPVYLLVQLAFQTSGDETPTAEVFLALRKPDGDDR